MKAHRCLRQLVNLYFQYPAGKRLACTLWWLFDHIKARRSIKNSQETDWIGSAFFASLSS